MASNNRVRQIKATFRTCLTRWRPVHLSAHAHRCVARHRSPARAHARQLCGVCTLACVDTKSDCPQWATGKDGKACEQDAHLQTLCPQSCGVCSQIHVKAPPDEKSEL